MLARYEAAVSELRAGLVDLESSPSYLMLSDPGLGPVTAAKAGPAVREAADLWPLLDGVQAHGAQKRSVSQWTTALIDASATIRRNCSQRPSYVVANPPRSPSHVPRSISMPATGTIAI